jgi:molybdate transport system substrate-binding protein
MRRLKVLSAGAAETLLRSAAPEFEAANSCPIQSEFGNAGVIAAKLEAGEAADLVILPQKSIDDFARTATIVQGSIATLGTVGTALAVPRGAEIPSLSSLEDLRTALLKSPDIYAPEWRNATAGIHFRRVLETLGIWDFAEPRLKTFPNGAAAMRTLASASGPCIGCTQATEILGEPGVTFAGYLPDEFKLETVYSAGVWTSAPNESLARKFIAFITGGESRARRAAAGFL